MKLIFEKEQDNNLSVKIRDGLSEKEFTYIEMIKSLRKMNVFEDSDFIGDITDEEKDRIHNMLSKINEVVTAESQTVETQNQAGPLEKQ